MATANVVYSTSSLYVYRYRYPPQVGQTTDMPVRAEYRIDCLKIIIINVIDIILIVEEVCTRLLLFHVLLRALFVDSENSGERK